MDSELIQDQLAYRRGTLLLIYIISYSLWKADEWSLLCVVSVLLWGCFIQNFYKLSSNFLDSQSRRWIPTPWTWRSGSYNASEGLRAFQLLTHCICGQSPHQSYGRHGLAVSQFKCIWTQTWYLSRQVLSHNTFWSLLPSPTWALLSLFQLKQFYSFWSTTWPRQQMEARMNPA